MEISILLPVYNERANLEPLIDEIEQAMTPLGRSFEVLAVDDGSTDGSAELLEAIAARRLFLKVVVFRKNTGQTAAFDAGFRHASGNIIVTLDADGQNDPKDIPAMIALLESGYDFISGWRKNRQDRTVSRKIPSAIANWIIRKVTGTKLHDMGCSLKVYRKEITDHLRLYGEMHRFIAVLTEGLGARVGEYVVNHRSRRAGNSKYGLGRTLKVLLDLMTVWFMRGYQTKPIYLFGGTGAVFLLLSFLGQVFVVYQRLASDIYVHRNPLFIIAIIFAVMGVQFIGMGIIAELVIRTYFESQRKETYLVAKTIGFGR